MSKTTGVISLAELSSADIESVLEAVAGLAALRSVAELRCDTVTVLSEMVPSQLVAWNELEFAEGIAHFEVTMTPDMSKTIPPHRLSSLNQGFADHIAEHPAISHFQRTGDGRPRTISDFYTEEEFHSTALYAEFYGQPEISAEDQLSLTLPQPEKVIGISLNRPTRDFVTRDRQILNLVRPHIVQAYRNSVALERAERIIDGLERAVEHGGDGLVIIGRHGSIEHLTPRARHLLMRYFPGDGAGQDRLPSQLADWRAASRCQDAPPWPFITAQGDLYLAVRNVPGPEGDVLLLSERMHRSETVDLRRLGLTDRQSEVMALVARGYTSKQVAAALHLRPRTVDKHVEQALRTLGTENRLAAVNLIRQAEWPVTS